MKKVYLLFLLALLPLLASAETVEINGIYYNLVPKAKVAEVTESPNWYSGKVVIPKTVTYEGVKYSVVSIGDKAFRFCGDLISVTIPTSVTSIGDEAFNSCFRITSVTIPNSITSIGFAAFINCENLTSVNIPDNITTIEGAVFRDCKSLTSVTIPNYVTAIHGSAFQSSGLTSVTIPNSVTQIDPWTFSDCNKLKTITIGSGIKTIYDNAFSKCPELTDVYCFAEDVPDTNSDAFDGSYPEYATLHVPVGSVNAYKTAEPWSRFKSIVKIASKVSLNKSEATIEKGKTLTLKATVTPTNLLDKSVTWKSSSTKIATVTSSGKVKGIKSGTATITCTSKVSGAKTSCKVTIVDGSVTLDKREVTLIKGTTVTLKPTVLTTMDDRSVTWTSSDTRIATVTTAGKVKGVRAGTATITCTSNATGLKATCTVNVVKGTVTLNKTEAFIEKGKTTTLKATLTPTTLEDMSVTWTSSDKTVATVSSSGKVKGVGYGTATITCTSVATGVSATCTVTIGKVVINIPEFTLRRTRTATLAVTLYPTTLTDKSVTWKSSDTKVATVSSSGKVKGVGAGTATITCTSNVTGLKGTCTVTVLAVSESRSFEGDDDTTGIDEVENAPAEILPFDVYDLNGRKVAHQVTTLDGLPNGLYIVNGKKILKK